MVETTHGSAPVSPRPGTGWADRVRLVLRGIGQTLITAGVIVLLFVVYEVYVTNYFADRAQAQVKSALKHEWQHDTKDPLLALPGQSLPKPPDGKGIAYLYIPRLGHDYSYAIVQGTSNNDLEKGPGHYQGTALPGDIGNFAVAGHRVTYGKPFNEIATIRPGDAIVVETSNTWYVYRAVRHVIVTPNHVDVVAPVPQHPGQKPTQAWMTMTACHPEFSARERYVEFSELEQVLPKRNGQVPAALAGIRITS